jgi:hypothetical protein
MGKMTKSNTKATKGQLFQGLLKVQFRSSQTERVSGDDRALLGWIGPHGQGLFGDAIVLASVAFLPSSNQP